MPKEPKPTTPKPWILLELEDVPLDADLLMRSGDLDIPIEPGETAQQALLRWADGPGRARLRLKLRNEAMAAEDAEAAEAEEANPV